MKHSVLSYRMLMLTVVLLCTAAMVPGARAAGRTLAQTLTACVDYSSNYELVETRELSIPAQTSDGVNLGANLGEEIFVVATSQESDDIGIDIFNEANEFVDGGNSNGFGYCYDGVVFNQCPNTGPISASLYCNNLDSSCLVRLDLYTRGTCSSTALAPATSNLDPGSSEPAIDPALQTPAEPDVLTPVPEPVSSSVPSSSTPSSEVSDDPTYYYVEDTSSSGVSIGVIVGCAVGGVVLIAAIGGLAFWYYKRRQRLAASKMEHDIGNCVPEKAIEPTSKGEMGEEEAGSEASDVVAHV
ncbi:hypothetical protein D9Q98_007712 [Chlorella vulgaris]|uniref:Uncharacterized protein n=1 Tax=Chlorella vulgaris TaxID=3077 RepID=A0A9D4THB9_CHLVU|nr:hypothetical protein D9Q98_007712 [Chlorella vulgaris]